MPTLLLVRHSDAEPRSETWADDDRPLTGAGRRKMREIAAGLAAIEETAPLVLTSPLVRALETARTIAEVWAPPPAIVGLDELAPGHSPEATAAALGGLQRPARVVLVGHEPDLGELAAWMIGARTPLAFRKGGVARVDVPSWPPARGGQLVWLARPKMLRSLA